MFTDLRFYIIIIFSCIFSTINSDAKIYIAETCSQSDVQKEINKAYDGDIILVPPGTSIWTTPSGNVPAVLIEKSITVQGAGIYKTIITDSTGTLCYQQPFQINETKHVRITGFTFNGQCVSNSKILMINVEDWRIDHCKFEENKVTGGRGIWAFGYGIIDHCTFIDNKQGVAIKGDGDASWARPLTLGTKDAVYIEDCDFNYSKCLDGVLDAYNGARYVLRYSKVFNTFLGHHGLDSGGYRSCFSHEVYKNVFLYEIKGIPWLFYSRGGTGVLFENSVTYEDAESIFAIYVANYRSAQAYEPWGKCDGSNPIDGNEDSTGYPCKDQIGRSTDLPDNKQAYEPMYEWGNTLNGSDLDIAVNKNVEMNKHIKENRDFFNDSIRPDYTPYRYPHPLSVPTLISPDSADIEVAINEKLKWYPYMGSVSYGLLVSKSPSFSDTIFETSNLSSPQYKEILFDSLTTYYWKVNAKYIKEYIASTNSIVCDYLWSESWHFTTGVNVGIIHDPLKKKVNNISSFNAYPSVISTQNNTLNFYCTAQKNTGVILEIYNGMGKTVFNRKFEIVPSLNQNKSTFIYSWDLRSRHGRKVSSGIYFPVLKVVDEQNRIIEVLKTNPCIKVGF